MYTLIPKGEKGVLQPQISVTASKKVAKTAVLRNKLRRRAYAALRPLIPQVSPGAAFLVSYLNANITVSIPELTEELREAFIKTGFYR